MVLGMSLATFTLLHVVISLIGIATGFVVVYGMLNASRLATWTAVFLATTVLTSVTGFLFPFEQLLPSHIFGIISLPCSPWRSSRSTPSAWPARGAGSTS